MTTGSLQSHRGRVASWSPSSPHRTSPFVPQRLTLTELQRDWREEVTLRLEELIRLEPGWDGYNGQPISLEQATFALRMLEVTCGSFVDAPQIVPGSNGEIQIEWHTLHGDVEVLVRAPYDVHAWRQMVGEDPDGEELNLTNDFLTVARWVQEVTEPQIAVRAAA